MGAAIRLGAAHRHLERAVLEVARSHEQSGGRSGDRVKLLPRILATKRRRTVDERRRARSRESRRRPAAAVGLDAGDRGRSRRSRAFSIYFVFTDPENPGLRRVRRRLAPLADRVSDQGDRSYRTRWAPAVGPQRARLFLGRPAPAVDGRRVRRHRLDRHRSQPSGEHRLRRCRGGPRCSTSAGVTGARTSALAACAHCDPPADQRHERCVGNARAAGRCALPGGYLGMDRRSRMVVRCGFRPRDDGPRRSVDIQPRHCRCRPPSSHQRPAAPGLVARIRRDPRST